LAVSLDCSFLIAPSVFSNVYFHQYQNEQNHLTPQVTEHRKDHGIGL
jgi:hypothetical protein